MTSTMPIDQAARERIGESGLHSTLFVEAGAGTGKTTQLVQRIVNTVLGGGTSLADIAAITFTEAAASELQARIRVAFERRIADPTTSDADRQRCIDAVADADLAVISTVHGFASRILGQFAVAAWLPPRVTVLDEVSSQLAHERRWERFVDRLHADSEHEELLYRAALIDVALTPDYHGHSSFKDVAANFAQNWDRLEAIDNESGPLPPIDFAAFDDAVAELEAIAETCVDRSDKLYAHLVDNCLPSMRRLVAVDDPHRKLRLLGGQGEWKKGNSGTTKAWGRPGKEVRAYIDVVNESATAVRTDASVAVIDRLMRLTASEVLEAARERRRHGGLEFHDLLVLARDVLRRSPEVRQALHDRFRHILLDEFQDTDPIQIELASLIAATPAAVQPVRWQDHSVADGRLFFVGDPKQSIYRFRRADIELFLSARDAYADDESLQLCTNFRTVAPIIDWVNAVFAEAMPEEIPGAQPRYEPLIAHRRANSGADHRPTVLGGEHPDPNIKAGPLREVEARDVARVVRDIIDHPDQWPVHDADTSAWRPAHLSDVTILIPTRTSLPYLREVLDEQQVPYRLATGTLVYDTQEVRDALAALRAIDDPNDTLSLVAALRSPLYGCSDVDLFTYHEAQPRWDIRASAPEALDSDHPVVGALAHLHSLWQQRWWLSPATMLDRLLVDRQAFLLAFGAPRPAEVWRRLRFLLDQARQFEESVGGDLRAFLEWAELQSADGARVHEPMLPETDDDALQVVTVHGSKGLEFPITILSGMTTRASSNRPGVSVLWGPDGPPEVRLRSDLATAEHKPRADLEEEMGAHEKLRLLYVAATRARDHLVVSGHHPKPNDPKKPKDPTSTFATRLSVFRDDNEELCRAFPADGGSAEPTATATLARETEHTTPASTVAATQVPLLGLAERDEWLQEREALLAPFRQPSTMSATAIAQTVDATIVDVDGDDGESGLAADQSNADGRQRPIVRRRGRAGSAIGRAVHAVLEYIDFADHGDLVALVERQCEIEAIGEHLDQVAGLVRSALASDALALAAQHEVHRELYVAAPVGAVTIEGYVDLLIVTPDGLVIVDYKTDSASSPAEIDAKVAAYELQGAAYAVALETITGRTVIDCRFVFCKSSGAIERSVADLDSAKQRVRDTVRLTTHGDETSSS